MLDYQREDVLVAILPLFHIYGQVVVLLTALSGGSRIVTLPRFEPEFYLQTVSKHKVNYRVHSSQYFISLSVFTIVCVHY